MDEWVGKLLKQNERSVRSIFIYLLGTLLLALTSGCGTIDIRHGKMPNIAAQEQFLKLGQSTRAEVETLLGKPYGKGRAMLPFQSRPAELWVYTYEKSIVAGLELQDAKRALLFIYFDADLYDGYIWFSNFPENDT